MAAVREEDFAALRLLLNASSKDEVRQLCQECFSSSASGSDKLIESTCSSLSIASNEANQLVCALHKFTRHIVYRGLMSPEEILSLFPDAFHQNLKNLLTKIMLENVFHLALSQMDFSKLSPVLFNIFMKPLEESIKKFGAVCYQYAHDTQIYFSLTASSVSLPRLVDMDWRVDIKTSSDSISRMAVPTCLLQLKIQDDASLHGNNLATSALTVELNKQTLDTMLDGLGRIRDQLSAVANK